MSTPRYLGVIADGPTDQEVIGGFARCLLSGAGAWEDVRLQGKLRDPLDKFWRRAGETDTYSLLGEPARDLQDEVVAILMSACDEFQSQIPRELRQCDLLLLNTDAEKDLGNADHYFSEPWAAVASRILRAATEMFYHLKAKHGHQMEHLPLILPLVLFPSTDILVAAAKTQLGAAFGSRGIRASELKRQLYGVDDLSTLSPDGLQEKALDCMTLDACRSVYRHLPEARTFVRSLLWNQTVDWA